MSRNQSSEALRRPQGLLRAGFAVAVVSSLVLGYVGLGQFHPAPGEMGRRPIDLVYYDLQLFVLGADPLQQPGPYPRALEIARFTAPAASLYALFEAARLLFAVELSRLRARRARGHAIVCGDSEFADALSRTLQNGHVEVIEIRTEVDEFVTAGEPLRIIGDARDPRVLRAAGIRHAATLYACARGSAVNAAVALSARRVRSASTTPGRLAVFSHIADPDLCATFQAAFLGRPERDDVSVDFFNISQIAARRLFDDDPLLAVDGRAPRLMVAGPSGFGTAVVVAAARSWRVSRPIDVPLPVTVVGPGAERAVRELLQRFPFLDRVCTFGTDEQDLLPLLAAGSTAPPPDRLLVCHRDEEHAFKTAMAAERSWRGRLRALVVRLDTLATFLDEDGDPGGAPLLDAGSGVLRVFGVVAAACDPALIQEDLVERLAHVIHDRYRQGRRERGEWAPGDPALEPWDRLSPRLQRANRTQAEDIGRKLAEVNCAISPRFSRDGDAVLSDADLDLLARQEHERWRSEHELAGWRYAPERSDDRKLHPGLCAWNVLPAPFRRRSRESVRELADILADAGFRIVRG